MYSSCVRALGMSLWALHGGDRCLSESGAHDLAERRRRSGNLRTSRGGHRCLPEQEVGKDAAGGQPFVVTHPGAVAPGYVGRGASFVGRSPEEGRWIGGARQTSRLTPGTSLRQVP